MRLLLWRGIYDLYPGLNIYFCTVGVLTAYLCRYRNAAALETHVKGPYFQKFVKKAAGLMAKPFELKKGGFLPASAAVARL